MKHDLACETFPGYTFSAFETVTILIPKATFDINYV